MRGSRTAVALIGMAGLVAMMSIASVVQRVSTWAPSQADSEAPFWVARSFVEAYGTFDYRAPDFYRERLLPLTAGPLKESLEISTTDPVAIGQQQVRETRVMEAHQTATVRGKVTVAVRAEQVLRRPATPSSQALETRMVQQLICDLVQVAVGDDKRDESWRVVNFRLLSEQVKSNSKSEVQ